MSSDSCRFVFPHVRRVDSRFSAENAQCLCSDCIFSGMYSGTVYVNGSVDRLGVFFADLT